MNTPSNDHPSPEPPKNAPQTSPLKLFGAEIPLPRWAVSVVAVIAIVAFPVFLIFSLKQMQAQTKQMQAQTQKIDDLNKTNSELTAAKKQLEDVQEKTTKSLDSYAESAKHMGEQADWVKKSPKVTVTHYNSDGCLAVLFTGAQPTFVKDPALAPQKSPAPGPIDGGVEGVQLRTPSGPGLGAGGQAFVDQLSRSGTVAQLRTIDLNIRSSAPGLRAPWVPVQGHPVTGKCLNPHPGEFSSRNGKRQGCWTQVWRTWQDGCTHYQWFNSCSASWDVDAKGKPRVYWTVCKH